MRPAALAALAALVALVALASMLALAVPAAEAKPFRFAAKRVAPTAAKCGLVKGCAAVRWRARRGTSGPAAPATPPVPLKPPGDAGPTSGPPPPGGDGPALPPPTEPPPPPKPACDASPWLGVIAEDVDGFRFRLTRTCVPAGTVLFQFRNIDLSNHNLWAEGTSPVRAAREVVADAEGETIVQASADLAAGKWRLYCSLPGHEAMSRLVDVTPAG